jgi:hypothetical protein
MQFVAGELNSLLLETLLNASMDSCTKVRAAVAYAGDDNFRLFHACQQRLKPLEFYGRYDHLVPIHPNVLKWFLDQASPNLACKLVPDILHSKVIWWVDAGAYIGSANLTGRAWFSNIEAGIFIPQDELLGRGMELELTRFFEAIDDRAHPLTVEVYREQKKLWEQQLPLKEGVHRIERQFERDRQLAKQDNLGTVQEKRSNDKRFQQFEKDWNETLQTMRVVAVLASSNEFRPAWIEPNVPAGVQADQFLHAYYYKQVRDGSRHPYEEFHERNSKNVDAALRDALTWWRRADFDHQWEEQTIYDWSPLLRNSLAKGKILQLSEQQFIEVLTRVHAVRDHALKQDNVLLGLPNSPQTLEDKIAKFGEQLWRQRSPRGRSVLELINHVVWGPGKVAQRIWDGIRSDEWRIPHIGISSLGEIIGWARPDDFPPRNMRTSKGLMALGYKVRIGL